MHALMCMCANVRVLERGAFALFLAGTFAANWLYFRCLDQHHMYLAGACRHTCSICINIAQPSPVPVAFLFILQCA